MFWMFIGTLVMILCALAIAEHKQVWYSPYDFVFWIMFILLILARFLDVKKYKGRTAQGDQLMTIALWRRYASFIFIISLGIWLAAHGWAYYRS